MSPKVCVFLHPLGFIIQATVVAGDSLHISFDHRLDEIILVTTNVAACALIMTAAFICLFMKRRGQPADPEGVEEQDATRKHVLEPQIMRISEPEEPPKKDKKKYQSLIIGAPFANANEGGREESKLQKMTNRVTIHGMSFLQKIHKADDDCKTVSTMSDQRRTVHEEAIPDLKKSSERGSTKDKDKSTIATDTISCEVVVEKQKEEKCPTVSCPRPKVDSSTDTSTVSNVGEDVTSAGTEVRSPKTGRKMFSIFGDEKVYSAIFSKGAIKNPLPKMKSIKFGTKKESPERGSKEESPGRGQVGRRSFKKSVSADDVLGIDKGKSGVRKRATSKVRSGVTSGTLAAKNFKERILKKGTMNMDTLRKWRHSDLREKSPEVKVKSPDADKRVSFSIDCSDDDDIIYQDLDAPPALPKRGLSFLAKKKFRQLQDRVTIYATSQPIYEEPPTKPPIPETNRDTVYAYPDATPLDSEGYLAPMRKPDKQSKRKRKSVESHIYSYPDMPDTPFPPPTKELDSAKGDKSPKSSPTGKRLLTRKRLAKSVALTRTKTEGHQKADDEKPYALWEWPLLGRKSIKQ